MQVRAGNKGIYNPALRNGIIVTLPTAMDVASRFTVGDFCSGSRPVSKSSVVVGDSLPPGRTVDQKLLAETELANSVVVVGSAAYASGV
jgi:hypothetical protein